MSFGDLLIGGSAFPIGLYIAWNFFQLNVFGLAESRSNTGITTFTAIEQGGSPLIAGGALGPEAGLVRRRSGPHLKSGCPPTTNGVLGHLKT